MARATSSPVCFPFELSFRQTERGRLLDQGNRWLWSLAKGLEAPIGGNSIQPRRERGVPTKATQGSPDGEEHVLGCLRRVPFVAQHIEAMSVDRKLVAPDQLLVGIDIAIGSPNDKNAVRNFRHDRPQVGADTRRSRAAQLSEQVPRRPSPSADEP